MVYQRQEPSKGPTMKIRILHTSDWHIGVHTDIVSRMPDHRLFFDWLIDTIEVQQIDVLVIAGDIFETSSPSADALKLYYGFLRRAEKTGLTKVVVVGGNHDSAARLDAPRLVLDSLDIGVVGGMRQSHDLVEMLIPLRSRETDSDAIDAVCLAVPFVHEYRLGIRMADKDSSAVRAEFKERFTSLYKELADLAVETYGDLPIIATGHLTVGLGQSTEDDYPQKIHQVGTIDALPASIFDPRICYAALGHIHRFIDIRDSVAWYCGSPISFSLPEMNARRRVIQVEISGDSSTESKIHVEPIIVPRARELLVLEGSAAQLCLQITGLEWETELPPLLYIRVKSEEVDQLTRMDLIEAVNSHDADARPVMVSLEVLRTKSESTVQPEMEHDLENIDSLEVFALLCQAKQIEEDKRERLRMAYTTISSATEDDFQLMLKSIEGESQ
jgi:DNA repair protein SbcD/Mre11